MVVAKGTGMPKKIDHEERKRMILQTALRVFGRVGYKDANLSLIASECGLSRPTLYQYFSDKDEIYYYAVKLVTGKMFAKYVSFAWDDHTPVLEKIESICRDVVATARKNESELTNLIRVMLDRKAEGEGGDFQNIIMHRTAKLVILLKRMVRSGVASGQVRPCDLEKEGSRLLMMLESTCLRIAFFDAYDPSPDLAMIHDYLLRLQK